MDHLHWRSLLEKQLATAIRNSHCCTRPGHLGQHDTNRIISIYIVPPKVAKARKEGGALSQVLLC